MKKNAGKVYMALFISTAILLLSFSGCGAKAGGFASSKAVPSSSLPGTADSSSQSYSGAAGAVSSSTPVSSKSAVSSASSHIPGGGSHKSTVTLTIDSRKDGGSVLANSCCISFVKGDTAYSVLKRLCDSKNIPIRASTTLRGTYVSSIDGRSEFDKGGSRGWLYSVNGTFPDVACNKTALKPGDRVLWVYTVDLGKSEEGGK